MSEPNQNQPENLPLVSTEGLSESPPWSRVTKIIVVILALLLFYWLATTFTALIWQIVAAGIIAYVMNPVIIQLEKRTPLKRGTAILLVYFSIAFIFIGSLIGFGVSAYGQILNFFQRLPQLVASLLGWLATITVVTVGPFQFNLDTIDWRAIDWNAIRSQLLGMLEPAVTQGSQTILDIANSTIQVVSGVIFVFIISIYMAAEIPKLGGYLGDIAHRPGYRKDVERLLTEFGGIWRAYLRGQVVLALIIGGAVWFCLTVLGVQNAFALGVLSGLLEFVPVVGPLIGTLIAVIVGLFQPENYLGLSTTSFVIAIVVVMLVLQQIENNILVPRITGDALGLHPLLVIVGVFMGTTLAGLVGAILAAPVIATVKLLGTYAWQKLFDLPPFPEKPPSIKEPRGPTLFERGLALLKRGKE